MTVCERRCGLNGIAERRQRRHLGDRKAARLHQIQRQPSQQEIEAVIAEGVDDRHQPQRPFGQQRPDLEVAWADYHFIDPVLKRQAYTRLCIARGSLIQALITFDYWPEDAARLAAVWAEVIRSLQLGRYINDPTVGDVLH